MRPLGEIALRLREAAQQQPGTVAQLAQRVQVGESAARYTCSRMLQRGELVAVAAGRPAVLGAAPPPDMRQGRADWIDVLQARFHAGLQRRGPSRAEERRRGFATL